MSNRLLETKTFKTDEAKLADAWVKSAVASYARNYEADGAELCWDESRNRFRTTGGDFVEGTWNWVSDAQDAEIVAKLEGSW